MSEWDSCCWGCMPANAMHPHDSPAPAGAPAAAPPRTGCRCSRFMFRRARARGRTYAPPWRGVHPTVTPAAPYWTAARLGSSSIEPRRKPNGLLFCSTFCFCPTFTMFVQCFYVEQMSLLSKMYLVQRFVQHFFVFLRSKIANNLAEQNNKTK